MASPHPNSIDNPFRSPFSGSRYARVLFWEEQQKLPIEDRLIEPMFTLQVDKPGLVNFRKAYVEMADPTGYKMGMRYLEDFAHWQMLMKSPWFRDAKERWDVELDAKLAGEGLATIRAYADGIEGVSPAIQFQAAKYLANNLYRGSNASAAAPPYTGKKRGRPSKEEIEGNLKIETADAQTLAADLDRIRLVKG